VTNILIFRATQQVRCVGRNIKICVTELCDLWYVIGLAYKPASILLLFYIQS